MNPASNGGARDAHQAWYAALGRAGSKPPVDPLTEEDAWEEFLGAPSEPVEEKDPEPSLNDGETAVLLNMAQRGSKRALSVLLERYHPRILRMVRRKLGRSLRSRLDSGDIAQDVVAEALRSLGEFKPRNDRSFHPWLRAIVENRIRNLSRSQVRSPMDAVDSTLLAGIKDEHEEEEVHDEEEKRRFLAEGIESLGGDQTKVLQLRYQEGLSYREIAQRMERSEAAVSMLLSRARLRLASLLRSRREGA